MKSNTIP